MIAIIRSGQNPTMRHLERTHGISIQWMHEIFQNDLIYLVYEVTSKMCADIHTKAFKDHMTWKRACMLINILSYDEISSEDMWSIMQPTHDISTGLDQKYRERHVTIPTFPYTETPILPPDLYVAGMTSKEGLQEVPNVDPFVVVKTPRMYRTYPLGLHRQPWLRSTWVLRNGQWTKIEHKVDPLLGDHRFDNWAERAVFQFHPVAEAATPVVRSRPRLELSVADLFHPYVIERPNFVNALPEPQVLVTNALSRIVHGGWDVAHQTISQLSTYVVENDMSGYRNKCNKDYWVEEGNQIVRVHNKPRSKLFDPRESPHPTIPEHAFKDERKTLRTNITEDNEEWKEHVDNWRTGMNAIKTNGFKWKGRTIFQKRSRRQYLLAPSIKTQTVTTIPLAKMFIVGYISSYIDKGRGVGTVTLIMKRNTGRIEQFDLESSDEDFELMRLIKKQHANDEGCNVVITMFEIQSEVPRMVLLCSEEVNWFTILSAKRYLKRIKKKGVDEADLLIVTITIHDDLNSDYGLQKASISLRDKRDTMFFAGPCTGGSSWARLNRSRGPLTEAIIDAKVEIFKQLWNRFETLFVAFVGSKIGIYMELPRGCLYWNNEEVKFMIEGTDSTIHDFDGCCYGLRQKFGDSNLYIKKPWRIVSWNVNIDGKLSLKCDGRHEHTPCAGRETIHTQVYTSKIVSIILEEQEQRCIGDSRSQSSFVHGDGSSGTNVKNRVAAAACATIPHEYAVDYKTTRSMIISIKNKWIIKYILSCHSKKQKRQRLRWCPAPLSVTSENPTSGSSSVGAIGTGRGARSNGQQACSEAMAARGSRGSDNKPRLFLEGDSSVIGAAYCRLTGSMLESLSESERQGRIDLPSRYEEDKPRNITLLERWVQFGIPVLLVMGLSMSEVVTDDALLWIIFRRAIALVSDDDLSLPLVETVVKIRKVGQQISLVTDNFVRRKLDKPTKEEDMHNVDPILRIMASAKHLHDIGPACQNLLALVNQKGYTGTLRELIGLEGAPRGTFASRDCPMYRLRRQKWVDIFNHAMRAEPVDGPMHSLESLTGYMELAQELLVQIAQCIRAYNFCKSHTDQKISVPQLVADVVRLYSQSSSPVIFTVPARAVAINTILGFSALFDMLRGHFENKGRFMESQRVWFGQDAVDRAIRSSFWEDYMQLSRDAKGWYGMGENFYNISFNVLGVESGVPGEVTKKNERLQKWDAFEKQMRKSVYEVVYEFDDGIEPRHEVRFPHGVQDPRRSVDSSDSDRGFDRGPQRGRGEHSSSSSRPHHARPEPKARPSGPPPKARPPPPSDPPRSKKPVHSNLKLPNPPPPVMFSESSLSADEDEGVATETNEWSYPDLRLAGRKVKTYSRPMFKDESRKIVITLYVNTFDEPCGMYDEGIIPRQVATSLVTEWEILLRRTTIYLCAWANGIVDPKVLRKYILKGNPEWVKLYRYIWLKSQANYLGVFPTPKTFALAKEPVTMLMVRTERTIIISDLPLYWKATSSGIRNDIASITQSWGWNSVQQYAPEDYNSKVKYLEQPCNHVAKLIENATKEDELEEAAIHIWVSMTDIIDYANAPGNSVSFPSKEASTELSSYFISCFQSIADAGKRKNPIIVNINANGEFLNCDDAIKFKRVSKSIASDLRSEGFMVTWGGPLWKELFPFIDAHGKIRSKNNPDKMVAVGALEKQLFREKTIMKCMLPPSRIVEMDHLAAASGIAKNEGLVDDPPEEYKFEDVNAIPLDKKDESGKSGRGRRVKPKMHVPNWGNQQASYQPAPVFDGRFFWVKIEHRDHEEDDDPMASLSGVCDTCSINHDLDRSVYDNNKTCANCSANYTLRSFGGTTDEDDVCMRIFLAYKAKRMFEGDHDWVSSDPNTNMKTFMRGAISVLLNTSIGKALSQYGFVRMHPSAAARMLDTQRGHLVVTTRFRREDLKKAAYYRFSYDMGNKLYAAYVHAIFPIGFIRDTFNSDDPKEEKLGDAIEVILGLFEVWDSVPECIPENLNGQYGINEIRRGLECSLINFCSIGEIKNMKNRKMNKRKGITEEIPKRIHGISPHLNYYVPESEAPDDDTVLSDLLDEAEEIHEEDDGDEMDEEGQDEQEDAEMVDSSEDEGMEEEEAKTEEPTTDDPMGEEKEEGPESKRRKVAEMMESILKKGVCLACGSVEHEMSECENQDEVEKIKETFGKIQANIKTSKRSFPKERRSRNEKKTKERRAPNDDTPDRVISLYPEEVQAFEMCAEYQDGHWTALGKHTNNMGPIDHGEVINEIFPNMDVFDRNYQPNGSVNINQETRDYYVDIDSLFEAGKLSITPRNGVRYWHEDYNDPDYLAPYAKDDHIPYPERGEWKFKAGGSLNYALRHQIGRTDGRGSILKCNLGAWVLIEDLLEMDYLWHDHQRYKYAMRYNTGDAIRIKKSRIGLIVDLTLAEYRVKGKSRFQILGLRAEDEKSLNDIIQEHRIDPLRKGEDPLGTVYDGWIMPVAIRATSGQSDKKMKFELDPYMMMHRLDLRTALALQGGYHVTSPSNLKSILENGIMPGGSEGNRVMSYFGVFPPWDRRNRSARTRSPIPGELWMLIIYVPPSELSRFGAGLSGSGDILVPQVIPPDEIKEIWIARNCSAEIDQYTKEKRWVITSPRKIFSRKLVDEIVTYADFKTLGIQGFMATREQVISDAIELTKRFPPLPLGDPQDLQELKEDIEVLKGGLGTSLKLEDETRSRVVMKLALYHVPSKPKIMRMHDRKCPCCLTETPSFIAVCLFCHAEFWSAGKYARIIPEGEEQKTKWDREKINKAAEEAYQKAQKENEQLPKESKERIQEDEKEVEVNAEGFGKEKDEQSKQRKEKSEEKSFADDDQQRDPQEGNEGFEDLSMFERNLQLPEEGAMCLDSNLQAAKYLVIYLMKRMQKGINTWWKVNINTSRKDKLKAWENGYRPDVTGDSYPVKDIDPLSGEPHALEGMDYLTWMRNHGKYGQFVEGNESIIVRSYNMTRFLRKLRWAFYRIGLNQNDLNAMIVHNKNQTDQQKVRRAYLGGSAPIVEGIVIQSDPSYVTMCRLIRLVTGCESFSMLSAQRSSDRHLSLDMEALVGDPLVAKGDVDQELLLLMNQYGLSDFLGHAKTMLQNLKDGRSSLGRQLIDNENYSLHIPQLQYAPPPPQDKHGQDSQGSDPRPKGGKAKGTSKSSTSPTVFAPGGKSYDLPQQSNTDSSQVGASAKAHAAKARPNPPDPPPSPRKEAERQEQREENTTYASDQGYNNDPGQPSQQPVDPNWNTKGRGKGKGQQWGRDDQWGHQGRGRGKGHQQRYPGGWEYRGWY